LERVSLNGGD